MLRIHRISLCAVMALAGCPAPERASPGGSASPPAAETARPVGASPDTAELGAATSAALEQRLFETRPPASLRAEDWRLIRRLYDERRHAPIWLADSAVVRETHALVGALCGAARDGLTPAGYPLTELARALAPAESAVASGEGDRLARLDVAITAAFVAYGRDLLAGRVDPDSVGAAWHLEPPAVAAYRTLERLVGSGRLGYALGAVRTTSAADDSLRAALGRYRELAREGGWDRPSDSIVLRAGVRDSAVAELRRRLRLSGELGAGPAPDELRFDRGLAKAVAEFQRRHELGADGVVGPATARALAVGTDERVRQLEASLERRRWRPDSLVRHIVVDLAGQSVSGTAGGEEAVRAELAERRRYSDSLPPILADTLVGVVLSGDSIELELAGDSSARIRLALAPSLELVRFLADPADAWDADRLRAALRAAEPTRVDVFEPMPVYILRPSAYLRGGRLVFRDATLALDARLAAALADTTRSDSTAAAACAGGVRTALGR
jgi:murein L,D-transpeptidase YcbB/YkuD